MKFNRHVSFIAVFVFILFFAGAFAYDSPSHPLSQIIVDVALDMNDNILKRVDWINTDTTGLNASFLDGHDWADVLALVAWNSYSSFEAYNLKTSSWENIGTGYVVYGFDDTSFVTTIGDTWKVTEGGIYKNGVLLIGETIELSIGGENMFPGVVNAQRYCKSCVGGYQYYISYTTIPTSSSTWYFGDTSSGCFDRVSNTNANKIDKITCGAPKYNQIRVK